MGSIQKRLTDDGAVRWKARYRGPDRRERSRTFSRKIDAQTWLATQEADLARRTWLDPDRGAVTVQAWAETWLDGRAGLKPKTASGYRSLTGRWIVPLVGDVTIGELEAWHIREWVKAMGDKGLSPSRVRQAVRLLSAMMRTAVQDRRVGSNPCDGVDLPRTRKREMRFLTHGQVDELAVAAGPQWSTLVLTLAYCGLRWGEAAALRRRDVDVLRRRLHVRESLAIVDGELHFGPTKTHQTRQVPTPAFLVDLLARHLETVAGDPDALVFARPDGEPLRHGQWWHGVWLPARRAAGLDGLRIHDLRHTCVALLIADGAPAEAIRQLVGHSTIVTTFDVYGHLFPDHQDALADGLGRGRAEALAASTRPAASRVVDLSARKIGQK